jgi:hypothetical protein
MEKIKLKQWDEAPVTKEIAFLSEWFVNVLIIRRHRYIIFSESKTLFSVIQSSQGISTRKDLEHLATDVVFAIFKNHGNKLPISQFENICSDTLILKTNNRRIVGSQNDLINMVHAEFESNDVADFSEINKTPLSFLNFATPEEKFMEELNAPR